LILLLTFYCVIVLALAAFPQNKNLLLILLFSPGLGLFLYHQKYRNLSPRKPLAKVWADHKYAFITLTVVLFLMSVLQFLDLIEFRSEPQELMIWIHKQSSIEIILTALCWSLICTGIYLLSRPTEFKVYVIASIAVCSSLLFAHVFWISALFYKVIHTFGTSLIHFYANGIAGLLTLEFLDADSAKSFMGKYFGRTLPNLINLSLFIACVLGVPSFASHKLSGYFYDRIEPIPLEQYSIPSFLNPNYLDGHAYGERIRYQLSKILLEGSSNTYLVLQDHLKHNKDLVHTLAGDLYTLEDTHIDSFPLEDEWVEELKKKELFRPIEPDWDVLISMAKHQGDLSDYQQAIAEFKSKFSEVHYGKLPDISTLHSLLLVQEAFSLKLIYFQPELESIDRLHKLGVTPGMRISLSGKSQWCAVLKTFEPQRMALLRCEIENDAHNRLRHIFDAGQEQENAIEILSRTLVFLPLSYLEGIIQSSNSLVVAFLNQHKLKELENLNLLVDQDQFRRAANLDHLSPDQLSHELIQKHGTEKQTHQGLFAKKAIEFYLKFDDLDLEDLFESRNIISPDQRSKGILSILQDSELTLSEKIELAGTLSQKGPALPPGFDKVLLQLVGKKPPEFFDKLGCGSGFKIGLQLQLQGHFDLAEPYLRLPYYRHPQSKKYDLWYQINRIKRNLSPLDLQGSMKKEGGLYLYYRTLADLQLENKQEARGRLNQVLKKDRHNSMALHLMAKYFDQPIDTKFYFPNMKGF
jgi:hypothetical protein